MKLSYLLIFPFLLANFGLAQKDPGVRGGSPGAGNPMPGLTANELALFYEGRLRTVQLESVCDTCSDVTLGSNTGQNPNLATLTNSSGLGARFNGDQCSVCHQQFRRFSSAESSGLSQQVPQAREPDVRLDSASQGRAE